MRKLLVKQFCTLSSHFHLGPNFFLSTLLSKTVDSVLPLVWDKGKNYQKKIKFLYIFISHLYEVLPFSYQPQVKVKVKWSRYRPDVAQRVGRGIALLFHDRGTRRGWVVSSTTRPHFTPGKDMVPILQEAGWAPGPVWTGVKSRPYWDFLTRLFYFVLHEIYTKCEHSTMCTGGSLLLDAPQLCSFASSWVLWELRRGLCRPSMLRGSVGWAGRLRLDMIITRDSTPDRPARSQPLYRLSYPAHINHKYIEIFTSTHNTWPCNRIAHGDKCRPGNWAIIRPLYKNTKMYAASLFSPSYP